MARPWNRQQTYGYQPASSAGILPRGRSLPSDGYFVDAYRNRCVCLRTATSVAQGLEVDRGGAGSAIGPQRVIRDLPATLPAAPYIQALAITARGGKQYQQR